MFPFSKLLKISSVLHDVFGLFIFIFIPRICQATLWHVHNVMVIVCGRCNHHIVVIEQEHGILTQKVIRSTGKNDPGLRNLSHGGFAR